MLGLRLQTRSPLQKYTVDRRMGPFLIENLKDTGKLSTRGDVEIYSISEMLRMSSRDLWSDNPETLNPKPG